MTQAEIKQTIKLNLTPTGSRMIGNVINVLLTLMISHSMIKDLFVSTRNVKRGKIEKE